MYVYIDLHFLWNNHSKGKERMAHKSHLESTSRTVTWRIVSPDANMITSQEFVIGKWTWYLKVVPSSQSSFIICPKRKNSASYFPRPTVSLSTIQVYCSKGKPKADVSVLPGLIDRKLEYDSGAAWDIRHLLSYRTPITIRVEFLDLKMPVEDGNDNKLYSIWAEGPVEKKSSNKTALASLGRMLSEKIQTDIVINASNGSIGAHRDILAANSPVFQAMFSNSYKEEVSSTINISDMTLQTCEAMLGFIYGKTEDEEFQAHRMELITAADKYDLVSLKEACELSLVEDIGPENVLARLQCAFIYGLHELKLRCLSYLVNFDMIHEVRDDLNTFFLEADRELISKVVLAIFDTQKSA